MSMYFLDAGGAFLVYYGLLIAISFQVLAIFLEALIMTLFKYNRFGKSLRDSFKVNLVSFVIGIVLLVFNDNYFDLGDFTGLLAMFFVSMLIETFLLYLLNKNKPVMQTLLVSFVMNLVTYSILFLIAKVY